MSNAARLAILATLALATFAGGCTTSRAVRAWHAGIAAEDAGKLKKARRKYSEAYARNGKHVGAELARLRLMARVPEAQKKADAALKKLLEKKSDEPTVLLFAALWALQRGELDDAQTRAAALPKKFSGRRAPELLAARRRLQQALRIEERRSERKSDDKGQAARRNNALAVSALKDGDPQRARDLLAAIVAMQPDAPWQVRFNLGVALLHLGQHEQARRQFGRAKASCTGDCEGVARNLALLGQ